VIHDEIDLPAVPLDGSRRETVKLPPPPPLSRGKRAANLLRFLAHSAEQMSDTELDVLEAYVTDMQRRLACPKGVWG
jgi:hypothetical protein